MKILLGLTGSVATILYEKLIKQLQSLGQVDVIVTNTASRFIPKKFHGVNIYTDKDEWAWYRYGDGRIDHQWQKNDRILHIELRNNYSALVIAPCSANTLAKLSNGICDNLLTSVARAWDFNRPIIIAPSMNSSMWSHPVTKIHLNNVRINYGYKIVPPQEKMLACNSFGIGALANIDDIVEKTKEALRWTFPFPYSHPWEDKHYGIPVDGHPGSFEAKRKNSIHTGVDLYADEGQIVVPVENGIVVDIEPFTGPKDNSPWWLDTDCVLVEGASGVVCYGEIEVDVDIKLGQSVTKGRTRIGTVKRVIRPEMPQHPELQGWKPNMLHMELYPHGTYKSSDGYEKDKHILKNPTPYLLNAENAPSLLYKL